MNKVKITFLLIIFYQNICAVEPISIGGGCYPAGAMRDLEVRKAAYPFDWMFSKFESVIQAFEDDFNHFLDPDSLYLGNPDDRIIDYYGLEYVHDFPTTQNNAALEEGQTHDQKKIRSDWKNFITPIREKYFRRIERLKYCLSGTEEVVFFRLNRYPSDINVIIKFRDLIQKKYAQLKFSIAIIEVYPDTFKKWKFENCESFCKPKGPGYLEKWKNDFNYFQIKHIKS